MWQGRKIARLTETWHEKPRRVLMSTMDIFMSTCLNVKCFAFTCLGSAVSHLARCKKVAHVSRLAPPSLDGGQLFPKHWQIRFDHVPWVYIYLSCVSCNEHVQLCNSHSDHSRKQTLFFFDGGTHANSILETSRSNLIFFFDSSAG